MRAPLALTVVAFALSACALKPSAFGERCSGDLECGPELACRAATGVDGGICAPALDDDLDGGGLVDGGALDGGGLVDGGASDGGADAGPGNRPPVMFPAYLVVAVGDTATFTVEGRDPEGDPLTFTLVDPPSGVALDGATLTYQAGAQVERVSFDVDASDGAGPGRATVVVDVVDPASFDKRWVGQAGSDLSASASWEPQGAPGVGETAFVPRGAAPRLFADAEVASLTVATGATLETTSAFALTVRGAVHIGGSFSALSTVFLAATGAVAGRLPRTELWDARVVDGPLDVGGDLLLSGDLASLELGGYTVRARGRLTVGGRAVLRMVDAGDVLFVDGDFTAQGGYESGQLSNGRLVLRGNFSQEQSGFFEQRTFAASGNHVVVFDGDGQHSVTFQNPGASLFWRMRVETSAGVRFNSEGAVGSTLEVARGVVDSDSPLTVRGELHVDEGGGLALDVLKADSVLDVRGAYTVARTELTGASQAAPALQYQDLVVTGSATLAAAATVGRDLYVSGQLALGGQRLSVVRDVVVAGAWAVIEMIDDDDRLIVGGELRMSGVNGGASYVDGEVHVRGAFRQVEEGFRPQTFVASGDHLVQLESDGGPALELHFSNPAVSWLWNAAVGPGVTVTASSSVWVRHDLRIDGTLTLPAPHVLTVDGTLTYGAEGIVDGNGLVFSGECVDEGELDRCAP